MARYRDDDDEGGSGRLLLLALLLLLLLGGGFFFWRSMHAPQGVPVASTDEPSSGTPSASAEQDRSCVRPPYGAAGIFELHFDFDKSDIRPSEVHWIEEAADAYTELARELADCPAAQLEAIVRLDVVGHADTAGPREYNQRLSERRAAEVMRQLVRRGVPESQIQTRGVGEDDLSVETPDNTPREENRRAPITITVEAVPSNS